MQYYFPDFLKTFFYSLTSIDLVTLILAILQE
jgi:hypothetical protein